MSQELKATDSSRLRVIADWMEQDGTKDAAEFLRRLAGDLEHAQPAGEAAAVAWFDKRLNTVRWKDGLVNADFADGQPFYTEPQGAVEASLKASWCEAWKMAFNDGLSAGHPLGRSYLDCDKEWLDSDARKAALAAPPVAANQAGMWQPIETAPKDGSMFLCWVSAIRSTYPDGEYGGDADVSEHDFCRWSDNGGNGYWDNMMGQIGDQQDVTHWMPLAAAPHTESHALGGGD